MLKIRKVFFNTVIIIAALLSSLAFNVQPVMADTSAPVVTGAEVQVGGQKITISFDQVMILTTGYEEGFEVKINNSYTLDKGSLSFISNADHTKYVLSLNDTIQSGQTVTISYTGTNVQSASGVALASFSNYAVTNNLAGTPPVASSPDIRRPSAENEWGRHLFICFSKDMSTPPSAPTGFTVKVDGVNDPVTEITVKPGFGYAYYLKLANLIRPDQNATVSYTPGTVTAADGGVLAAFGPLDNVTNDIPLRLSNISLSGAPSNYTFNSETTTYDDVTVAANVESITVVPTGLGVITVNGTAVASGAASAAIPLTPGAEQSITVHTVLATPVYYQNYKPITYTINITREAPQATPTFSPAAGAIADGTSLEIISTGADHIYYTLDGSDPATSVTGTTLEYNDSSRPVINSGTTVKAIAVKAGKTDSAIGTAVYTQIATADLSGLELSGNPVNYVFQSDTYSYGSVAVANSVSSLTITPAGAGTIAVNGTTVVSGSASEAIDLTAGVPKTITVTALETGKSIKSYTITVTRNLPALAAPAFEPSAGPIADGTLVQIIAAGADHIYYTLDGTDPVASVAGTTLEYDDSSRPAISHGATVKAIAVAAGRDNSLIGSASYTWADSTDLTGLALSGNPSNYTFSGGTYNYAAVKVANSVANVTVTPSGAGTITVDGAVVASGTSSGNIALIAGKEKTVVVTVAETGKNLKTYIIKITRANPQSGSSGSGSSGGGSVSETPASTPAKDVETAGTTPYATGITTVQVPKVGSDGKAAAAVTETQIADATNIALAEAAKLGKEAEARIEIKIDSPSSAKSVEVSIPSAAVKSAADRNVEELTVSSKMASLTFDDKALSTILKESAENILITVSKQDKAALSDEAKQIVGDRPVFDFSVSSGNKTITKFDGSVTIAVPYELKAGEDPNSIVIYYINAAGKPEIVTGGTYDPAKGVVTFATTHFSTYAVGYNKVSFTDVKESAWYCDAVNFIAARGITTGTSDNAFDPKAFLTRGQFVVMLMKTCSIIPESNIGDNFSDAGSTYYTEYLAMAKKLGIIEGIGNNNFAPENKVSRQDMFTMLYRTLDKMDILPADTSDTTISDFRDQGHVAVYAQEGMNALLSSGIVSGDNGKLNPLNNCTRAEMAQVLKNLLSK